MLSYDVVAKKKILTVAELTSKAGKVGGKARAAALSPERRSEIAGMGGLAGGKARAKTLTAKRRKEIASDAAKKRWGGKKDAEKQ
jgi:general stress protein YciG